MRKYTQLVLVVVATLSLALMILYERKYSKVKMVLEMINAFGSIENPTKPNKFTVESKSDIKFSESVSWTYVTDFLYLYAAYWNMRDSNKPHVMISAVILESLPEPSSLSCFLWYNSRTVPTLAITEIDYKEQSGFFIKCFPPDINDVPYGVTLSYNSVNSSFIQIIPFSKSIHLIACIEPLHTGFKDPVLLAEHLTYHSKLGINYFIIYDKGISPESQRLLQYAKNIGYDLDIVHWNYPGDSDKRAYLQDCFVRSNLVYNTSYVIISKLSQFFVLKHSNFSTLLKKTSISQYKFTVNYFCKEFPEDIVAETLDFPFVTIRYLKRLAKHDILEFIYRQSRSPDLKIDESKMKSESVSPDLAVVHLYDECHLSSKEQFDKNYIEDAILSSYKDSLFMSPLYKYLEENNLSKI